MTSSDWIRSTLAWLATYGVHSSLFLGGAWLLCALRAPRVNRDRERVWKLALVGGVLSTTLQLALGARPLLGRIDWHAAEPRAASVPPRGDASASLAGEALGGEPSDELGGQAVPLAAAAEEPGEPRPTGPSLEAAGDEPPAREPARRARPERAARLASPSGAAHRPDASPAPSKEAALVTEQETGHETPPSPSQVTEPGVLLAGTAREPEDSLRARLARGRQRLPGLVLGGWIAIGLAGVLGLVASWTCLRRRMLGRRVLAQGPLVEALARLQGRAGLKRRVRLSVSPRVAAPFSTGLLQPEICVPEAALHGLSSAQQEALLAHELAHVLRRDPAWFGASYLIEKLFFFQPLNRLARRELAELAEVACDDWAVRWTGARLALASCLTEVAGWLVAERPRLVTPPGLAGQRSRLAQRVQRLLDDRRSPHGEPPAPWWPALAAGSLALAALAVPGVAATSVEAPGTEPAPAGPAPTQPSAPPEPEPTASAPVEPAALDVALEGEMLALEVEIAALHAELEARALDERFAEALERIDARMDELRAQHERARELLARLRARNTPASAPAEAPAPNSESAPSTSEDKR